MPLQFTEDLDILFLDVAVTGEWAYIPSSGVMPHTDKTLEEFHTPHDAEFQDYADLEMVHPSELSKKRPSNIDGSSTKSKTKKKFTGATPLNKTLDRIVNVVESSSATLTQTSSRYPSIAKYLVKLESIPGVSLDDELYVWAARLFLRDKRRKCFMTLPTDEVRLRFLKLEIEMEKTTIGWERSAHDTRIFLDTIRNPSYNFPKSLGDEFYLVDAGYPNMKGYLASYKGERYHLAEFEHGQPPKNAQEKFNQVHSSLRSIIERKFGVWKARWPMIKDIPPNHKWQTQVKLICGTMAIHNFIRRSEFRNIAFDSYDRFTDYVPNEEERSLSRQARHGNDVACYDNEIEVKRHNICMSICRRN
ncbi:hypothetical protein ACSBR2_038990 [Camellia fascicularis]